jgi:hypothetical protein
MGNPTCPFCNYSTLDEGIRSAFLNYITAPVPYYNYVFKCTVYNSTVEELRNKAVQAISVNYNDMREQHSTRFPEFTVEQIREHYYEHLVGVPEVEGGIPSLKF